MVVLARACGHDSLSHFTPSDLTSWKRDVADLVGVALRGGGCADEPTTRADDQRGTALDEVPDEGRVRTAVVGRPLASPSPAAAAASARSTTTARTRAARWARARSRTGWLRCPWHGYDYDPMTGTPPAGFTDAPRGVPGRGARRRHLRRRCPTAPQRARTVSDVMVETMVAWGVDHVFGMVGHSNLGFADALRRAGGARRAHATSASATRAPPRSPPPPTASSPAGPRPASRSPGPGSTNLLTGLYDAKVDRAPVLAISGPGAVEGAGPGRVPGRRPVGGVRRRRGLHGDRARAAPTTPSSTPPRVKHARRRARRRAPRAPRRGAGPARSDAPAGAAGRPPRRPARRAAAGALDAALDLLRAARRPVIIVGHGARGDIDERARAGRAARRAGAHDVQGQGPGPRRPPARRAACSAAAARRWRAG